MPGDSLDVPAVNLAVWSESAFENFETVDSDSVLVQGFRRESHGDRFNSLAVTQRGKLLATYDKSNLVPWSEFVPFDKNRSNLSPGTSHGSFTLLGRKVGCAICYDICFTDFMRGLSDASFIVVPANEAIDPTMKLARQTLAATRLRAVELRRTIVRNANGGYSGIVDGSGYLRPIPLNFGVPTTIGAVPIDSRFSLYALTGPWLPIICCAAIAYAAARRSLRRITNDNRMQPMPAIAAQSQSEPMLPGGIPVRSS